MIQSTMNAVGYQHLKLDASNQKLLKTRRLELDLSAIAKGYAVDSVSDQLAGFGVESFLVEIGGEVYAKGTKPNGQSWRVAIEAPNVSQRKVNHVIDLNGKSVASSGDYRNYMTYKGQVFGHIINPKTGFPVTHQLYSVTVVHESAMVADGWATAFSVIGPERGLEIADQMNLAVLFLMDEKGEITSSSSEAFTPYL